MDGGDGISLTQQPAAQALGAPSPFGRSQSRSRSRGGSSSELVGVEVDSRGLVLTARDGEVFTARPTRAVISRVATLTIYAPELSGKLILDFENESGPPIASAGSWARRYQGLGRSGYREVLIALRDQGVSLDQATGARATVGAFRFSAYAAVGPLILAESLLVFGPSSVLAGLASGGVRIGGPGETALVIGLLAVFLVLHVGTARMPVVFRQIFRDVESAVTDPVARFDMQSTPIPPVTTSVTTVLVDRGRSKDPAEQSIPTYVPFVPVNRSLALGIAVVLIVLSWMLPLFDDARRLGELTRASVEFVTPPAWLSPALVAGLGFTVAAGMTLAWAVQKMRARRGAGRPRHVLLICAGLCLLFAINGLRQAARQGDLVADWSWGFALTYLASTAGPLPWPSVCGG